MWRGLLYFLKAAFVIVVALWLVEHPGFVTIEWEGYIAETSVGFLVFLFALIGGLLVLLFLAIRQIGKAPQAFEAVMNRGKRREGYRALTQGLVSVAVGDAESARVCAERAEEFLQDPTLTLMLAAQASEMSGDEPRARKFWLELIKRPEAAFLALRGLILQEIRHHDQESALRLAVKAQSIKPNNRWLLATLFSLQVHLEHWQQAEKTLSAAVKHGAFSRELGQRHLMAVMLAVSDDLEARHLNSEALAIAIKAHKLAPNFIPATIREARLLIRAGKNKQAQKLIEEAWSLTPHPKLAEQWEDLAAKHSPSERVKWAKRLIDFNADTLEADLLVASEAINARQWADARTHLDRALQIRPSRRGLTLLAKLEAEEKNDHKRATEWLNKAVLAPPEERWLCGSCGTRHENWTTLCTHCNAFDTIIWRFPDRAVHTPGEVSGDIIADENNIAMNHDGEMKRVAANG